MRFNTGFVSLLAFATLLACGGRQTMASKSASAYAEAQKKGLKVGAGQSGAAEAPSAHAEMAGMDHSKMDHSKMTGMDHSKMAGIDHSKMPGMDHSTKAVMDHSKMPGMKHQDMPSVQHDMPAMEHGAMKHGSSASAPDVRLGTPTTNTEIAQTRPADTLRQDEFDAPPRDEEERR